MSELYLRSLANGFMNSFIYSYRFITQSYSIYSLYRIIQVQTTFVGADPTTNLKKTNL